MEKSSNKLSAGAIPVYNYIYIYKYAQLYIVINEHLSKSCKIGGLLDCLQFPNGIKLHKQIEENLVAYQQNLVHESLK